MSESIRATPPNSEYPPDAPTTPWPCVEGVPFNTTTQTCEPPPLAHTGLASDPLPLILTGGVLLALGVLFAVIARRVRS